MAEFIIKELKKVDQPIPDFIQSVVDPNVSYERPPGQRNGNANDAEEPDDVAEPGF